MPKSSVKSSKVDNFIYKLKSGKAGTSFENEKKLTKKDTMRHDGPAVHSYPEKQKLDKLIPYEKLAPAEAIPNQVKLGVDIGEDRFPADAKVPNVKKYDENGNYIKHKRPMKKDTQPNLSVGSAVRSSLLSNPETRGRRKTVAPRG